MNLTGPDWQLVNIGSGNVLASSGNSIITFLIIDYYETASVQKEAMLIQVALCFFMKWNLYR